MRGRTAVWTILTGLVVAASALMPRTALWLQDRALVGQVQSWETETADLSLLAELSPAQTLAAVGQAQSCVALDRGRELDGEQAERIAVNAMNTGVFSIVDPDYAADRAAPSVSAQSAGPWLYMGPSGQNVIFWQVELAGAGYNPLLAVTDPEGALSPFTATALVDDRSGHVASLLVRWTAFAAAGPEEEPAADPAEAMPTEAPMPPAVMEPDEAMDGEELPEELPDPYYIDQDAALALCGELVYGLVDGMASYSYGADIDIKAGLAYLRLDGEDVTVPMTWTAAELRFNG